jgi:hypothetical protein
MRLVKLLPGWLTSRVESEPYDPPEDDPPQGDVAKNEAPDFRGPNPPPDLQEARRAAKERYQLIAKALKREAGVRRHYTHKSISGLAWIDSGKILAPDGITRRQLYVLAHECGHIVLHSSAATWNKPGHIKEHEAETYAHRAFERYGLEVLEKSAQWARAYVGQWIMKDRAAGISVCPMAEAFASGRRTPEEPLPSVDGHPKHDFSKMIAQHTAKSLRVAARRMPLTFNQFLNKRRSRHAAHPTRAGHVSIYVERPTHTRMTINARLTSRILTSLATMPDYATVVLNLGIYRGSVSMVACCALDRHRPRTTA